MLNSRVEMVNIKSVNYGPEFDSPIWQFLLYSKIWLSKDKAIFRPTSLIQPRQFSTVISVFVMAICSIRISRVNMTPFERIKVFHLPKSDSIGFSIGLYAGRKMSLWPDLWAQLATTPQWWNRALSMTIQQEPRPLSCKLSKSSSRKMQKCSAVYAPGRI